MSFTLFIRPVAAARSYSVVKTPQEALNYTNMESKKRVLCGYGVDVDAIANHINTGDGSRPNLSGVSRGKIIPCGPNDNARLS